MDAHIEKNPSSLPTLAAVIPVYNREQLVLETLESVRSQTCPPNKVIIVDDGSSDNSVQNILRWITEHGLCTKTWILIRQDNAGVSVARNAARPHVQDIDLVAFLDSDDLWPEDFIHRSKYYFKTHTQAIAASCDSEKIYITAGQIEKTDPLPLSPHADAYQMLRKRAPLVCATTFSRPALEQLDWFDPQVTYAEDHLLWHLIAALGSWGYMEGTPFQYRYFQDQISSHISSNPHLLSRVRCARKLSRQLGKLSVEHGVATSRFRWVTWKTWYAAGRACEKAGKKQFARCLYWEAVKTNPWRLKALLRYVRLSL